jgi:hypothetical protein
MMQQMRRFQQPRLGRSRGVGIRRYLTAAAALTLLGVTLSTPTSEARSTTDLSLEVTFSSTGTITVTLPDGTPIGSTTGAPTVIPAGYYTLALSGPQGCSESSYFELQGPGQDFSSNMNDGAIATSSYVAYFMPNSTYTWTNNLFPNTVHTFATTADIQGTKPTPTTPTPPGFVKAPGTAAKDPVGSDATRTPFRGNLHATVTKDGTLRLTFKERPVTALLSGDYDLTVADESQKSGFVLLQSLQPPINATGATFRGTRNLLINLTPGRWQFTPRPTAVGTTFRVS